MPGEPIWDKWEDINSILIKFAWILTLVGGILGIIWAIWGFFRRILWLAAALSTLISGIVFASIAIVGAILYISISKQMGNQDYANINLVMVMVSAALGIVGCAGCGWFYMGVAQLFSAVLFCFLSEYGWFAKESA